jgi:hypothetical protein
MVMVSRVGFELGVVGAEMGAWFGVKTGARERRYEEMDEGEMPECASRIDGGVFVYES